MAIERLCLIYFSDRTLFGGWQSLLAYLSPLCSWYRTYGVWYRSITVVYSTHTHYH